MSFTFMEMGWVAEISETDKVLKQSKENKKKNKKSTTIITSSFCRGVVVYRAEMPKIL